MKTDNELIAEFMGVKKGKVTNLLGEQIDGYILNEWGNECSPSGLRYNTSWDWLMPVVEKIQSESGFVVEIRGTRMKVWRFGNSDALTKSIHPGYSLLEVVFCGVVDFIKWHNQQKP